MIFRSREGQEVKLIMWEKTEMPDSDMVTNEKTGKKEFVKNGKTTEMTTYTLRDGFGNKFVVLSKDNSYRSLEGEMVEISVDLVYNDFNRKTQIKLASMAKAKSE